jgi:hypothetical protein
MSLLPLSYAFLVGAKFAELLRAFLETSFSVATQSHSIQIFDLRAN